MSFALGLIIFVIGLIAVIAIAWTMTILLVVGTPGPAEALRRWSELASRARAKLLGESRFEGDPGAIELNGGINQTALSSSPSKAQPLADRVLSRIRELARRALDAPAFANEPSSTPWQDDPNIRRWTVLALAVGTSTIVVVLLWLAPGGSLYKGLEADGRFVARFLTAGLGLCVLFLGSALTKLWCRNRLGRMVEYTLFGAGVSLLGWLAVSILPTVYVLLDSQGRLEFQEGVHANLVAILALRWPISILPVGLGLLLGARHPLRRWHNGLGSSVISALASVYAGGLTMWALNILGESVTVVAGLGVVALTVSISLAFVLLASHGVGASNVVIAGVSRWADQSRLRAVNVGFLVGVYAAFLRPLIFGSLNYSLIWEWLLGTSVIIGFALLTGGQINKLRHASERNQEWKEWRTHQAKEAEDLPHESMERLVLAQKAFVEIGVKEDLITNLVSFLHENRVPTSDIIEMVEPIVNHQDRPISLLAVWGARRRTRERNSATRRVLLRDWTEIIQDLVPQLSRGYVIRESHNPAQSNTESEGAVKATSA